MDSAQLPDLDSLDREALKTLLHAHQEYLRSSPISVIQSFSEGALGPSFQNLLNTDSFPS
jgi:hypothetical protein